MSPELLSNKERFAQDTDELIRVLKQTMPFQVVSDALLGDIAALARRVTYRAGELIYRVRDDADDLYVVVSGEVQHTLASEAHAQEPERVLRTGEVFGWAAVLAPERRKRL